MRHLLFIFLAFYLTGNFAQASFFPGMKISRVVAANGNATSGGAGQYNRNNSTGLTTTANEYARVTIVMLNLNSGATRTMNFGTTQVATVPGPGVRIDNTLLQVDIANNTTTATYEIDLGPGQTLYWGSQTSGTASSNNPYWYLNAVVYINSP